MDDVIASGGIKSGYRFKSAPGAGAPAVAFTANGTTVTFGTTGTRNFFSDQTFVIKYNTAAGDAAATDKPLQ